MKFRESSPWYSATEGGWDKCSKGSTKHDMTLPFSELSFIIKDTIKRYANANLTTFRDTSSKNL
jgi:hypothetical protein